MLELLVKETALTHTQPVIFSDLLEAATVQLSLVCSSSAERPLRVEEAGMKPERAASTWLHVHGEQNLIQSDRLNID